LIFLLTILFAFQEGMPPEAPANLYNQLIQIALGLLTPLVGAVAFFINQRVSAARNEQVRRDTERVAAELAVRTEAQRIAVEQAVQVAVASAIRRNELEAEVTRTTVRHDLRAELIEANGRACNLSL